MFMCNSCHIGEKMKGCPGHPSNGRALCQRCFRPNPMEGVECEFYLTRTAKPLTRKTRRHGPRLARGLFKKGE